MLAPEENSWGSGLAHNGYQLRCFEQASDLCRQYRMLADQAVHAVVLMGDVAANCRVAQQIRSRGHGLFLVARAQLPLGNEIAALLSQGVDCVLRPEDTADCLLAVLRALDYRRAQQTASVEAPWRLPKGMIDSRYCIGPWQLAEKGWLLMHGEASLRLTPAERVMLLGLFEAPGHVLPHQVLLDAVMQIWPENRHKSLQLTGCRDLFSRLRGRAERAGLPRPPIESLRDYGYAWAI